MIETDGDQLGVLQRKQQQQEKDDRADDPASDAHAADPALTGQNRTGGTIAIDNAARTRIPSALLQFLEIDAFPQFLARLEVRDVFFGHLYPLAGLRITPRPRRPVVEPETAESADLDSLALGQTFGHGIEDHLDREFGILGHELRELRRQAVDQFRFGHHGLAYP